MAKMSKNKKFVLVLALLLTIAGAACLLYQQMMTPASVFPSVTLTYTDGTSKTYSASNSPQQILLDPSNSKTIASIKCDIHSVLTYTGTLTGFGISGTMVGYLYDASSSSLIATLWSKTLAVTYGSVSSGVDTVVLSETLTATQIQGYYSGWQNNKEYYYVVYAPNKLTVKANFSDGTSQSATVDPLHLSVKVKYSGGGTLQTVSISFVGSATYAPWV